MQYIKCIGLEEELNLLPVFIPPCFLDVHDSFLVKGFFVLLLLISF